jgi:hypothetical protein
MTRNDDFDQTLAAWLRREAPPQAPDRVLDAALERVAAQSQQRGWLQSLMRGNQVTTLIRVAAVAAVVAFAAFIGYQLSNLPPDVGASPSPSVEANPSQTGLPSASASPSTDPAAGGLVLRLWSGGEAGRVHSVTVLEDGHIITTSDEGATPLERRLTASGVQLLRDELDATGLTFLASADYMPVAKPGTEEPGMGGAGPALEVGLPDGGTAVISWVFFNDIDHRYDLEPQPEAEALEALYARLTTFDEWLPANAWADASGRLLEGCVYPPTDITTLIDLQSTGPLDPAGDPIACYGNAPLTFDATWVGGGVADCPAAPEPAWLACSAFSLQPAGDTRKVGAPQLFVAVDPSVSASFSEPFSQVRVTGHFDDPAAQTCRETQLGGGAESLAPTAETTERCRRTFVITDVVLLSS